MTVLDKLVEYIKIMLPHWGISSRQSISPPTYIFTCVQNDIRFDYVVDKFLTTELKGRRNFKLKRIMQLAFLIAHQIENAKG